MGCTNSKDDDFAAHTLENDELFIDGHFKEVVPEAAEKPSTTFITGQPKPTSWLVGNGSPTQAPVTRRRSWDALPPKATTPVRVAKLTTELDALSERHTDLRLVHLHDPAEWRFDMGGVARFFSPEGGAVLTADPADVAAAMPAVVAEYLTEVRGWLGRNRAHHVLAPTDQPLGPVVATLLRGV